MAASQWQDAHASQLSSQGVPRHLWPALQAKLASQLFDAGEHLLMDWDADGAGWHVLVANPAGLRASDPNAIFLVDHAWRCARAHTRASARARTHQSTCLVLEAFYT